MSTDSGGPGSKKEKPSDNGTGSGLMEGAASTDEEHKRQTMLAEAISAIEAINLQSLQIGAMVNFVDFATFENEIKTFKNELTEVLNAKPLPVSKLTDLCHCCGTFVQNVKLLAHVMKKQELSNNLKTFLSHYRKLLEYLYSRKDIQIIGETQNLKSDVNKIAKSYCETSEEITCLMTNFQGCLELYQKQLVMPSISKFEVQKCYLGVSQMIISESEGILSQIELIKKSFLDKDMPLFVKEATNLQKQLDKATYLVSQCYLFHIWGISGKKDLKEKINFVKLLNVCCYLKDQEKPDQQIVRKYSVACKVIDSIPILLNEAKKIEASLNQEQNAIVALENFICHIKKHTYMFGIREEKQPKFKEVYSHFLDVICRLIFYFGQHWSSPNIELTLVDDFQKTHEHLLQILKFEQEYMVMTTFEYVLTAEIENRSHMDIKDFSNDHAVLCKSHLQAIPQILENTFSSTSGSTTDCFEQIEKLQEHMINFIQQLLIMHQLIQNDETFLNHINDFKSCLVECIKNRRLFENLAKVTDEMIIIINSHDNQRFHNNNMKLHEKNHISLQRPELRITHFFIDFHIIIILELWKLGPKDDIKLGMQLYFENEVLYLPLEIQPVGYGRDYTIMSYGLAVARHLHKTPLHYKYCLYTTNSQIQPIVEMLHTSSKPTLREANNCYRILDIPNSDVIVYDSCIHPQIPDTSFISGIINGISGLMFWKPDADVILLPIDRSNELEYCIDAHLFSFFEQLQYCNLRSDDDLCQVYDNLIMAFKSFSCAKIKNLISRYPSTFSIYKGNPVAVFEKYLSSVLDNLQSATSTYKILSGLLLSNLFIYLSKSKPDIPFDIAKKLLTTLTVHYNPFATYQCESYMIITTTFSKNYKRVKAFIDNILIVMQSLLKHDENVSSLLLIMHVLPIYYWFNVEPPSCPFQPITSNLEPCVVWLRDLKIFDNVIIAEKQLEALLKGLQPIELEAAPILQLVLIQVCHEYTLLLKYVPVPMILCFICINLNYKKLSHKMVNNISALLTHIGQNIPEDVNYHGDLIDSLFKLLITMNEKFVAVYKYGVLSDKILENSLRIIFKFLTDEDLGRRDVTFLPSLISTWVQCKINSKVFCNEKLLMEYKFWVNLDSIGNKQQYWSNVLSQIISDRFLRVTNFESKVHVFETLLQQDKELNIVTLKLNEILKFEVSKCTKMDISKLAISLAGRNILDHFIQTSFPTDPNAYINVEVLPVILKCVSDNPEDFSEHTLSICSRVNKYFIDLESYIFCGDVTVQWLLFLRQKWNTNVMEILKALTMDHVKFNEIIYQSERKLLMFLLHKELLQNIVSTCAEKLQVTPIPMMKFDDLKSDYTTMTVKSLCFYNDNRDVIFPAFPEADDLCNMLIPFAIMNSPQFQNDIYYYKWKECSQDIDNESTLSDIFHKLWSPVFTHCSDVIDKLESQDMYLNDAIDLFSNTESAQIARTIQSLHTSVMNCRQHHTIKSLVNAGITSIDGIVNHIKTSSESANWIKAISEKVKICSSMGDLTHEAEISIETFSLFKLPKMAKLFHPFSKEGINHFLRRKLSSVSEVEEKILLFLHDSSLQEDIVKKSIKELGESKKLIEFIWNKSNDVNEMDRFVTIALDTFAGEGAEVQDRLIDLTELCSRFSPLLYDLTEDCESIIVLEKFQSTWKFLSTCDNLSNLMKTCLLNIDWYWSIDELQDASEQGTMKQLQDINQFGVYTVKTTEQFHVCSVSLEITEDEENISKRNYSLDDLQELSSKLILITRQTSRWVKDKEYFEMMLREICQISVAVQKLKEYGHMKFLDYEKQFPCISTDSLAKLDEELDNLEFTLTGWIKYTWSCRYKFPHLNFYTTNQLMLLRKEFTHFQNVKDYDISIEVFHLLYSIIGKPVDSTILIKKTLMDKDTEDSEENVDDEVIESESATSHTSIVNETNKDQSDDKVEQGIKTLDPDQRALYDELFSCGYPEYLSLEAITTEQISDVYAAIEWCDEHEDSTVIKNKWLGSEETVDSSFNIDIDVAKEMHSTLSPLTVDNSSSFSCIDSSHIASYFFNLSSKKSNPFERSVSVDNCNLISLKKLGYCLQQMATRRNVTGEERTFTFEKGTPNLIVTSSDNIYFCILQIYSVEKNSTLPTYDEVLLCSSNTSLEQVVINMKNNFRVLPL